jgi:hypothetical protein
MKKLVAALGESNAQRQCADARGETLRRICVAVSFGAVGEPNDSDLVACVERICMRNSRSMRCCFRRESSPVPKLPCGRSSTATPATASLKLARCSRAAPALRQEGGARHRGWQAGRGAHGARRGGAGRWRRGGGARGARPEGPVHLRPGAVDAGSDTGPHAAQLRPVAQRGGAGSWGRLAGSKQGCAELLHRVDGSHDRSR